MSSQAQLTALSVTPSSLDFSAAGGSVQFVLTFSDNVSVDLSGGTPSLMLSNGQSAVLDLANTSASAVAFTYSVMPGDDTSDLVVGSVDLGGGDIIGDQDSLSADLSAFGSLPGLDTQIIIDTTAPALLVSGSGQHVEAVDANGAAVSFTGSATDAVDGTDVVGFTEGGSVVNSGGVFAIGHHDVLASTIDGAGNPNSTTISFDVVDTTAPALVVSGSGQQVEAADANGAAVSFTGSATDAVDGTDVVGFTEGGNTVNSGDVFAIGHHDVLASTIDAAGNANSTTISFDVVDTTAPALVVTGSGQQSRRSTPTAPPSASPAPPPTRSTAPTWSASPRAATPSTPAACSPSATTTFSPHHRRRRQRQLHYHQLRRGRHHRAGAGRDRVGPARRGGRRQRRRRQLHRLRHRAVDGTDVVGFTEGGNTVNSGGVFAIGHHDVLASTIDAAGNANSTAISFDVVDTTAPALVVTGSGQHVEAVDANGAAVSFSGSATDAVDGTNDVVGFTEGGNTVNSGGVFAIGHHDVLASTIDAAGNPNSTAISFDVVDTTAPDAPTGLADASMAVGFVNAVNNGGAQALTGMAEANSTVTIYDGGDFVDTVVAQNDGSWSYTLGSLADGSHSLTATATDAAGNTGAASASLDFVVDASAPTPRHNDGGRSDQRGRAHDHRSRRSGQPGAAVRTPWTRSAARRSSTTAATGGSTSNWGWARIAFPLSTPMRLATRARRRPRWRTRSCPTWTRSAAKCCR